MAHLFGLVTELKLSTSCFSRDGTELHFLPKSGVIGKYIDREQWLLEMESAFLQFQCLKEIDDQNLLSAPYTGVTGGLECLKSQFMVICFYMELAPK